MDTFYFDFIPIDESEHSVYMNECPKLQIEFDHEYTVSHCWRILTIILPSLCFEKQTLYLTILGPEYRMTGTWSFVPCCLYLSSSKNTLPVPKTRHLWMSVPSKGQQGWHCPAALHKWWVEWEF